MKLEQGNSGMIRFSCVVPWNTIILLERAISDYQTVRLINSIILKICVIIYFIICFIIKRKDFYNDETNRSALVSWGIPILHIYFYRWNPPILGTPWRRWEGLVPERNLSWRRSQVPKRFFMRRVLLISPFAFLINAFSGVDLRNGILIRLFAKSRDLLENKLNWFPKTNSLFFSINLNFGSAV